MTNDELAFLDSIIRDPDNDMPRLAFAEWLEEHGDDPERAEFIRVQCERANLEDVWEPDSPRYRLRNYDEALRRREQSLLRPHEWDWLHAIHPELHRGSTQGDATYWLYKPTWRRGFVEAISMNWELWLESHSDILKHTPLREVQLTTEPEWHVQSVEGAIYSFEFSDQVGHEECEGVFAEGEPNEPRAFVMLASRRWPGIKFTLPTLHEVARQSALFYQFLSRPLPPAP